MSVIVEESNKCRAVFEAHHKVISSLYFGNFPNGSCGNACCFLAQWLRGMGLSNIKYIYGTRDGVSHAWLEIEGVVVDITSDQFADGLGAVYVGSYNSFHNSFSDKKKEVLV